MAQPSRSAFCGARVDTIAMVDPGVLVNVNTAGDFERVR
jgi:hypothetical protein